MYELLDGMTLYELLEHWMYEELRGGVNTVGIMKRKTMRMRLCVGLSNGGELGGRSRVWRLNSFYLYNNKRLGTV